MKTWIAGLLIAGLCLVNGAMAAPLHYKESESGDLPGPDLVTLHFDLGTNIIEGSSSAGGSPGDLDGFHFVLPQNSLLTDIGFAFQATFTGTVIGATVTYILLGNGLGAELAHVNLFRVLAGIAS